MIRLRRDAFEDPHEVAQFAATAHLSIPKFLDQFKSLIQDEPPQLTFASLIDPTEAPHAAGPPVEEGKLLETLAAIED